jgi:hypothetical protein
MMRRPTAAVSWIRILPLRTSWTGAWHLAGLGLHSHAPVMFAVSEADAATIRAVFHQQGELSATAALRRLFPGLDAETARECTRTIAGWESRSGQRLGPMRLRPDSELPVRPKMAKTPQSRTPLGHELPGRRQGLLPGTLKKPFFGPHGDEHRDSPPNAPSKPLNLHSRISRASAASRA